MQKKILISIVNLKCHSAIRNGGECNSVWKTIYLSCKQMSITDNQTFLQYAINQIFKWLNNVWTKVKNDSQINVKIPIPISTKVKHAIGIWGGYQYDIRPLQSLLTHPTLWYKSIYIPNQNRNNLLKSYFRLDVCKWPYFYKKLSKHCLGARCWSKHVESSNFNGFPDKCYL